MLKVYPWRDTVISLLLNLRIYYGWWVLLATAVALLLGAGSTTWTLTILIRPMTDDFGSSHVQLLGALTVAGILGALSAPVIGRIADRYGSRAILVTSLVFLGLTLILTSRIQALWQFYLVYGVGTGLSQSGITRIGSQAVAANWFIRKRGIAFATLAFPVAIAGVVFAPLAQAIVDWSDWRMVWMVLGLAILALPVPLVWLVVRRRPEDLGLRPDGDLPEGNVRPQRSSSFWSGRPVEVTDVSWSLGEAARTRAFWLLNGSLLLVGFPSSGIIVVMHPYFTELGVSTGTATALVSFYSISNGLGVPFWGILVQLFSARTLLVPFALLYGSGIVLLTLTGETSSVPLMYLALLPLGIGLMGSFQLGNQVLADYYGRRDVGAIIGMSNLIRAPAVATGALVAATFHDTLGSYQPGFVMFAAFCLVAAVALFFVAPPRRTEPHRVTGS